MGLPLELAICGGPIHYVFIFMLARTCASTRTLDGRAGQLGVPVGRARVRAGEAPNRAKAPGTAPRRQVLVAIFLNRCGYLRLVRLPLELRVFGNACVELPDLLGAT